MTVLTREAPIVSVSQPQREVVRFSNCTHTKQMSADVKRTTDDSPRIPVHAAQKTGRYRAEIFLYSLNSTCSKIGKITRNILLL